MDEVGKKPFRGLPASPQPATLLSMSKHQIIIIRILFGLIFSITLQTHAQFSFDTFAKPSIRISTAWSASAIKAGGHGTLAVIFEIPEPFHINSHQVQAPYIPTTIRIIEAPSFLRSSTPIFPTPHDFESRVGMTKEIIQVFSGKTIAYLPVAINSSAPAGKTQFKIQIRYQACNETQCFNPTEKDQTVDLDVAAFSASVEPLHPEIFANLKSVEEQLNIPFFGLDFKIATSRLGLLLCIAAIGGFLLNLTPCVLPLLPIKMMGLAQAAGNRRRCFMLGLVMSLGVVVFWMTLAVAICTISGFNATNKLFQYPAFTVSVGVIICVMALGMSGLFAVRLPSWIYSINPSNESVIGSFLFGIMTAVLSTPCTAPFMGAAAAWSATQAPKITLVTFGVIGLGMALPYLLLSAFPGFVRKVPRTGPASDLVKQVMGLLMLAAGAYFLGTGLAGMLAKPPDPASQTYWWFVAFFIVLAGLWLLWKTFRITQRIAPRLVFGALSLIFIVGALGAGIRFTRTSPIRWVYFTPERFAHAQQQRKPILLEFTAAWCLNCHALEQSVLHHPEVVKLLNSENLIPMKVDITGNNPAGDQKLIEVGSRAIPYLVLYGADGTRLFASDAYTVDQLLTAIRKALPPRNASVQTL